MSEAPPLTRILAGVFALVLAVGCGSGAEVGSKVEAQPAPEYQPVADVLQTMEWILDPAADAIWDSAGFVITAEGETDLQPTTDDGWQRVLNGAVVVAETGNLLMMPGRSAGPDWNDYARGLTEAGGVAMAAAKAQNAEALFDAGGQVYQACRSCHDRFLVRP